MSLLEKHTILIHFLLLLNSRFFHLLPQYSHLIITSQYGQCSRARSISSSWNMSVREYSLRYLLWRQKNSPSKLAWSSQNTCKRNRTNARTFRWRQHSYQLLSTMQPQDINFRGPELIFYWCITGVSFRTGFMSCYRECVQEKGCLRGKNSTTIWIDIRCQTNSSEC